MPPTMTTRRAGAESSEALRSDTASVLHRATVGICKTVAGSLGVCQSRVNKLIAGGVANPLEILVRWIDRLEREGVDAELIDEIPRYLARRRQLDLVPQTDAATPASELTSIADDLAQSAELHAKASRAAADGIDEAEAALLLPLAERHIESAQAFKQLIESKKAARGKPLRAVR